MRVAVVWIVAAMLLPASSPVAAEEASAGGRLAWVLTDELELLGDLWVDLPFRVGPRDEIRFGVDTRTNISRTTGQFAFVVQDLEYNLDLGWHFRRDWLGDLGASIESGQRGKEFVDADGQPYVRYLGVGLESSGKRLDWQVVAGAVLEDREVDGTVVVRGDSRLAIPGMSWARSSLVFDLKVDGLIDGSSFLADMVAGPRWVFPVGGERSASFYLHYQDSRNPLGVGPDLWLFGFQYDKEPSPPVSGPDAAEVDGLVAAGAGDGRLAGRLLLRALSPDFGPDLQAVLLVDANILTSDDTGDLYYFYHAGIERRLGNHRTGAYFYHRSNHQLAEPNDRITSINVFELGIERDRHFLPGRRDGLEAWARVGYLLNSSFGEDRQWHARGGVRYDIPRKGDGPAVFAAVEAEAGDVERETYAVGLTAGEDLEFQLSYRSDSQYFARDRTAILLTTRYGF